MISQSAKMKHRAAAATLIALLASLTCLAGLVLADRMIDAARKPHLDLRPILKQLQQVRDSTDRAPLVNFPAEAYQQVLGATVPRRPDILAAVVVSEDGIILAGSPGYEPLVGQRVTLPPPGKRYPVPGLTTGEPTPEGYYPFLRPADPANGPSDYPSAAPAGELGGPYGPAIAPTSSLDDPQVEWRLQELLRSAQPAEWPARQGNLRLIVKSLHGRAALPSGTLLLLPLQGATPGPPVIGANRRVVAAGPACALMVVPRPNEAEYEIAADYLLPGCGLGAVLSFLLYWLALPWWVYLDARPRTEKAAPLAVFVLLTNFLGWLTYLVIRPEAERLCPVCVTLMEPSYRCCPQCGWSSKARCRSCGRPARSDWLFCPYCETPRTARESGAELTET